MFNWNANNSAESNLWIPGLHCKHNDFVCLKTDAGFFLPWIIKFTSAHIWVHAIHDLIMHLPGALHLLDMCMFRAWKVLRFDGEEFLCNDILMWLNLDPYWCNFNHIMLFYLCGNLSISIHVYHNLNAWCECYNARKSIINLHYYRQRSKGDHTFGSVHLSVCMFTL